MLRSRVKNGWLSCAVSPAPRFPIVNTLSSVTSTHVRTHQRMAQRARPGVSGVAPPVKAAKNSTAAPAPNTVSALRATPGASAAVTGSRFFTSSPGRANTSTSVSTPASRLTPMPRKVTKNASPNSPNTTEGTPARLLMPSRR